MIRLGSFGIDEYLLAAPAKNPFWASLAHGAMAKDGYLLCILQNRVCMVLYRLVQYQ